MLRDKNKGFGDIPQQAKIDEFTRSESERICQFFRKCICTYCACSYYPEFQIIVVILTLELYRLSIRSVMFGRLQTLKVGITFVVFDLE